jgi:xylulokinase
LGEAEYQSGLVFGRHVAGGGYYWMGGMSASGGSIEWLRGILDDPALSYQQIESLLEMADSDPTGILYFPYLSGSGSPHTDIQARGAVVGLEKDHTRADLVKAVLEGTAFEAEFIRQAAQKILGKDINSIAASGGGTRMEGWMQIKADVSGCTIQVLTISEAAMLGAALIAGIGIGLYRDAESAFSAVQKTPEIVYQPDISRNHAYQALYQKGFLPLQDPLREVSRYTNQL